MPLTIWFPAVIISEIQLGKRDFLRRRLDLSLLQKEYQLRPLEKLWADLGSQQKRLPEVERRQTCHDKLMDDYHKRYPGIDKLWTR